VTGTDLLITLSIICAFCLPFLILTALIEWRIERSAEKRDKP